MSSHGWWSHVVLGGLTWLASVSGAAAGQPPQFRMGVVIEQRAPSPVRDVAAMVAEADAIWRPHGVVIGLAAPDDVAPESVRMAVVLESTPVRSPEVMGLGSIWFAEDGLPVPFIRVNVQAVAVRIRSESIGGRRFESWPEALERRITARALGRVLAHEIGHYVLASPAHSRRGLMRESFSGRQLAEWDRGSFALESLVLPRLRARLAQLRDQSPVASR